MAAHVVTAAGRLWSEKRESVFSIARGTVFAGTFLVAFLSQNGTAPFSGRAEAQQAINSLSGVTLFFEGSIIRSRLNLVRKSGRRGGEQVADPADQEVSVVVIPSDDRRNRLTVDL